MPSKTFLGFNLSDLSQLIFWAKLGLTISTVLFIGSISINCRMPFTNDYRKSLVDASPIAALSDEQISRLERVIKNFENYDFWENFEIKETPNHPFIYRLSAFVYPNKEPYLDGVSVSVAFYWSTQKAIERIEFEAYSSLDRRRVSLITNDNNTQLLLYDSEMVRGELFWPTPDRYVKSMIRLENVTIHLTEFKKKGNLEKNVSTDFIMWLCEELYK